LDTLLGDDAKEVLAFMLDKKSYRAASREILRDYAYEKK